MSKIFTDAEIESLNKRLSGSKSDKTGIFSARVKPKIKEILEDWIPKKKILKKLVGDKR
jgi:hypothetical protein